VALVWRWRKACPCCYDFEVPEADAVMPEGYAEIIPRVLATYELFISSRPSSTRPPVC
jgi:hypothetical protein